MPTAETSSGVFDNSYDDVKDSFYLGIALACILGAALAQGMTMGLLSFDKLKLKIKMIIGSEVEKKAIERILPLIENHHFLLCTLLLFNACANEALPVILSALVPAWCAILISIFTVLVFGEIIPTAVFTGPKQLTIAARFTPLVYMLQFLFFPVSYPVVSILSILTPFIHV